MYDIEYIKKVDELAARLAEDLDSVCKEVIYDDKVKIYALNDRIESLVNGERSKKDNNIREITNDHDKLEYLLEQLCSKIHQSSITLSDDFKIDNLGAILAVTFSGVVAARLDANFQAMKHVYDWCDGKSYNDGKSYKLTKDYSIVDFPIIKTARYYSAFGSCRGKLSEDRLSNLPEVDDLKSTISQAQKECEKAKSRKDRDEYIKQMRVFLADAIMQLPPYRQKELEEYSDLLVFEDMEKPLTARISYNLSKASYARAGEDNKSLDNAIEYAVSALQEAAPADINFIELCRQNLLILEQEKVARETTTKGALRQANDKLDKEIVAARKTIDETIAKSEKKIQEDTQKELKDILLRVIEILGIFLAVAGIGVTAVGGIAVSDSFLVALGIYLGGTLAVVILFMLLRLMVLSIKEPITFKDFRRKKQDKPANDKDAALDDNRG